MYQRRSKTNHFEFIKEPALCNECFHCFCFPCIQQWSQQSNQCPVCRREYGMILYNIRSETEYDEMPVSARQRTSEFEIILPLNNLIELDRTFERLMGLPPTPLAFNPFQLNAPFPIALPPNLDQDTDMITLSVTDYNQPEQTGQRVIQRTFIFSDPANVENLATTTQQFSQTNLHTPSTSLEQNNQSPSTGYRPLYNPMLIPETNLSQQPTVVYNPNYTEPYRNLDPFVLPFSTNFQASQPTDLLNSQTASRPTTRTPEQQFEIVETLFDRLFDDLTRIVPAHAARRRYRSSFPLDNSSSQVDDLADEADENLNSRSNNRRRDPPTIRRSNRTRNRRTANRSDPDNRTGNYSNRSRSGNRNGRGGSSGRRK